MGTRLSSPILIRRKHMGLSVGLIIFTIRKHCRLGIRQEYLGIADARCVMILVGFRIRVEADVLTQQFAQIVSGTGRTSYHLVQCIIGSSVGCRKDFLIRIACLTTIIENVCFQARVTVGIRKIFITGTA